MKRFSIILLGALAIMMAGCSKDIHTASKEPESNDWLVNLDLPVPIQFNAGGLETKAAFSSMDELLSTASKQYPFGIFAINKSAETINDDDLLLNNERALYIENEGNKEFRFMNSGNPPVEQPKYYPMVSDRSYDFYGYYSRKNTIELSESESTPTRVSVNVAVASLDSDILWAKASTGAGEDGYHAKYIRKHPDQKPTLNFSHVTSCLQFRAVYSPKDGETASEMEDINVSSITLKQLNKTAKLCVIDLDNPDNEGQLSVTGEKSDVLISGTSTPKTNLITSKDGNNYIPAEICDDFFIAPQDEALEVQFVIKYTPVGGTALSQTVSYTLDPSKLGASVNDKGEIEDEDGNVIRLFEANYKYGFNIKIYSPEQIRIDVTLESYKDAFTGGYADIVIE